MGTVQRLLLFYGHGQEIFEDFLEETERELLAGTVSPLCTIMKSHGSDKGLAWHNYTYLYHQLFSRFLKDPTHVFELGVGTNHTDVTANMGVNGVPGASLRGWREYFPTAVICGADIDTRVLFQEPGIQTLYVDQTDINSVMSLWEHLPYQYDVILDDGLHQLGSNETFLAGSKHRLKDSGIYIIEDIVMSTENILAYDKVFNSSVMSGFLYRLPYARNSNDNAVAVLVGPNWPRAGTPQKP